jgi:hypothetical protein
MRRQNLSKWENPSDLEGLLVFAQSLDELLFDHSLDSFKAPALNLHLSLLEVRSLLASLKAGRIKSKAVCHCICELEALIATDPSIPRPIPDSWSSLLSKLKDHEANPSMLFSNADALTTAIGPNYWKWLKAAIIEAVKNPKEKRKLVRLSRAFSTEVELRGFAKRYVYYEVSRFFFNTYTEPNKISSVAQIEEFLSLFEQDPRPRQIIFRGSSDFRLFEETSKPFDITISDTPPEMSSPQMKVNRFLGEGKFPLFITVNEIVSKDVHMARSNAEHHLGLFADVCRFANHTVDLELSSVAMITELDYTNQVLVNPPPNPMTCHCERDKGMVNSLINRTISILGGNHLSPALERSFRKILDYHDAALSSKTPENQLLNLWSSLEGFLPPPHAKASRIDAFLSDLIPILSLTYPEQVIADTAKSLFCHSKDIRELVSTLDIEGTRNHKVLALLVCSEYEEERIKLCELLETSPLLRFRCFWIHKAFRNSESIKATLSSHQRKVTWQIKRIYATRNQIAHSAEALPYLSTLVENLHSYVDILVNTVVFIGMKSELPANTSGIMTLTKTHVRELLNRLDKERIECTKENFMKMVFGEESPLTPWHDAIEKNSQQED